MPLAEPLARHSRFGAPLQLSKVHWVRPEVVVEVTYLTWTEDNLLRQVSYQGQREDKPARQVVRPVPHAPRRRWSASAHGTLFKMRFVRTAHDYCCESWRRSEGHCSSRPATHASGKCA